MIKKNILIVEDDSISAVFFKSLLEAKGYNILGIAESSEEAMKCALKEKPDLVIMDIQLKGKTNGIETAKQLKTYDIPVIFITGNNDPNIYKKAKTAKPVNYILKPVNAEDLLNTVDFALNRIGISKSINLYAKELQKKNIIEEVGERAFRFFEIYFNDVSKKNLVVSTTTMFNILNQPDDDFDTIINLKKINNIQRINKFFENVNSKLCDGGIFIGHAETKGLKKKQILSKHIPVLNYIVYFIYFLYKRVWPKLPLLRKAYFFLTKGRNRSMSRAEVLGRLYSCGFEVIHEEFIDSNLHFIVKKIKKPSYDMHATYDMLIRMKRVGKNGKIINVMKFRTMHPYSEYLQDYIFKHNALAEGGKFKNDFRVTTLGRFFRKFWIDELPMLINIIRGDLKLVGVRPLSLHYYSLYPKDMQEKRIKYKPGLIPPFYVDMPKTFDEIVESERKYIDNYEKNSFTTDVSYFFKAFYNIFFKKARSA